MPLPMAAPAPFRCTGCGDCCRGFAREKPDWEPQQGPVIRLSDEPGLPLMSWEYQRFRSLEAERGKRLDLQPFDGVLDLQGKRLIVLSYRMGGLECPFFETRADLPLGDRSKSWGFAQGGVCGVYEHRPLACRAYPLVPLRNGIAMSVHCPELMDADITQPAELLAIYGDSSLAAIAFKAAPDLAVQLLRDLERAGHVRVLREAGARKAEGLTWPRVDLSELCARHGLPRWEELEQRARVHPPGK